MSKDTYLQLLLKVFFSFGKYVYKRDAFKKVSYRHPLIFVFNFFLKADFLYIKLAETHLKLIKCFLCYSRNKFYSYIIYIYTNTSTHYIFTLLRITYINITNTYTHAINLYLSPQFCIKFYCGIHFVSTFQPANSNLILTLFVVEFSR